MSVPDNIGNITVPEIAASGTFPIVPDYPYGRAEPSGRGDPPVRVRQREDRAALPAGHGRAALHRAARVDERHPAHRAPELLGVEVRAVRRVHLQRAQRRRQRHDRISPAGSPTSLCPGQMVADWVCSRRRDADRDPGFEPRPTRSTRRRPASRPQALQDRSALAGPADDPAHQDPASPGGVSRHLSLRPALHGRARNCTSRG